MIGMQPNRRDRLTLACSFIAVSIVFIVAGGLFPAEVLPKAPDQLIDAIPHVNVVISLLAIVAIIAGWRWIREGDIYRHRIAMVTAFILFVTFLTFYLYRLAILGGPAPFDGNEVVYRFVYLPILTMHILLAVICVPLLFDALALALTTSIERLPTTRHPTVGRFAASLWIISFLLGIGVYLILYWL